MNCRIRAVGGIADFRSGHAGRQRHLNSVAHTPDGLDTRLRHPVVAPHVVQTGVMRGYAAAEVVIASGGLRRPSQLGHRHQTRIGQIFGILFRTVFVERCDFLQLISVNKLVAPETGLHAQHRRSGRIIAHGGGITFFQAAGRLPGSCLHLARCAALGKVEIQT